MTHGLPASTVRPSGRWGWRWPRLLLPVLSLLLGFSKAALAQTADVIRPDAQGDFRSISEPGPRGSVVQRYWLVVDADPRGLHCRDALGRAWIRLRYGSVLQLDQPEQLGAAQLIQGKPYLRMAIKSVDLLSDRRLKERGQSAVCFVRANRAYVAPIQPDSLEQMKLRP